jgi:hypothetical protein
MNGITTVGASEFILLDHHPDASRRPAPAPGLIGVENRRAALTWNVFRTLELIAPAFWLRRFRARLGAFTSLDSLTDLERFAASRTGRWLESLGIPPTA